MDTLSGSVSTFHIPSLHPKSHHLRSHLSHLIASSSTPITSKPESHHKATSTGYAVALLDVARCNNVLEVVERDVKRLSKWLCNDQLSAIVLVNPCVEKGEILKEIVKKGKFHKYLVKLVKLLVEKNKVEMLSEVLMEFGRIYDDLSGSANTQVVFVSCGVKIEEKQILGIARTVQKLSGAAKVKVMIICLNYVLEKSHHTWMHHHPLLHQIIPLLHELTSIDIIAPQGLTNFLQILYHEIKEANKLITDCSERSRFYILLNCRSIAKQIDDITKQISHALSCFSFASLNISFKIRDDISQLVSEMQNADFRVAMVEEEILEKIESGLQERNVDRIYANTLLVSIAKAIGVSTELPELRKEFSKLKSELENLHLRKHDNEAIHMDQMIALLERADAASSLEDRENKYLSKRQSLGMQPLEPLLSFVCPITKEVMVDPVETPSGHTFERSAIMKWLLEADEPVCPLTSTPLDTSMLRPNKTLRQSIEEWKERNTMITVASLKSRLLSGQEEEGNDDAKGIAKLENSIEPIVQFLGRRIGERKLAVALLLELSKCTTVRDCIGKVQGCILLLVTMLGNTDRQAAKDAKDVLDNLSYSDDNVVLMAKSNYFRHLLERLSSDSDHIKMTMAKTLGEMELTDHNKSSLAESGVLDEIIKKGAVPPLLDILYQQTSPQKLRELVAATIVHLALSTIPEGSHWTPVWMLESDDDISKLFSLINLTSPPLQQNILQAFHAMCLSPSANAVKSKLRECSAVQTLFQLCEVDNIILRPNAVKLLCCLTEDGDEATMLEHLTQTSLETLLKLSKTSDDEQEIASTLGIIANLPNSTQISEWLLQSENLPKIFSFLPDDVGTSLTIRRAAISLAQLSGSSPMLSRQIPKHQGFWCFSALPEEACPVHQGICTVESSFCLVEAGAIPPLIRVLRKPEPDVCEAALDALLTLINGEMLQNGCKVLAEANGMPVIIKLISSPSSSLQEKVLNSLQRIFHLVEYKQKYGASAQMPLVDLTQRRDSSLKSLAAKVLAQLNVLHNQSSYF
ncbi:UNVERIFIED_CONTAM: U-box domain-containing protein 44 [Sesamum angustifolium]|uniref:RING-type E3 ubiquitin transferase n=1 Tax=Sesamum angustifolium TaxID=2727405 RepID=A0AAW2RIQ6_9LAMI